MYIFQNTSKVLTSVGYHGYDDLAQDMHGVFFAKGPGTASVVNVNDIFSFSTAIAVESCNVYFLFCASNNYSLRHYIYNTAYCIRSNSYYIV